MIEVVRTMPWDGSGDPEPLVTREWLVTNGLGGYASGTVGGVATRRYHGLLVAALPAPHGRTMTLTQLAEQIRLPDGSLVRLGGEERRGREPAIPAARHLRDFRLEMGLPVWTFDVGHGFLLEKRVVLVHGQNTAHVSYRLARGGGQLRLKLQPSVHFRGHDDPVSAPLAGPYSLSAVDGRYELKNASDLPPLRLALRGHNAALTVEPRLFDELLYRVEEDRGYESTGEMWSPGYFRVDLAPGQNATLVASTEPWQIVDALDPRQASARERDRRTRLLLSAHPSAQDGPPAELVIAGDAFIISPIGRVEDVARAKAAGDEIRSVIAGYHWFTDWGRDTMISLEGLTLCTGRPVEAGYILRTFAEYVRDGLIPNMFPEGQNSGVYHTSDATLWYFHALHRYLLATRDRHTLRQLFPKLKEIVRKHIEGTRFGIRVDPADGLLRQGEKGYQLTWMDAKCGDWVVTPRRGKAVEINALWYNALRLLEGWSRQEGEDEGARALAEHAARTRASFNRRFWNETQGCLYDVVDTDCDGDDDAIRPNQLLAISLDHPVLEEGRWRPVLETVRRELLTPVGLRSLARSHPDYKPNYHGDLKTRDAAYHQGTVWSWLIGPFIDAHLRVNPEDREGARKLLGGLFEHLGEACLGQISEVFDAEPPYTPRGCVAQAWGVAETLRAWVKTARQAPLPLNQAVALDGR
jgi:predicted glycogen debranching enzyme